MHRESFLADAARSTKLLRIYDVIVAGLLGHLKRKERQDRKGLRKGHRND